MYYSADIKITELDGTEVSSHGFTEAITVGELGIQDTDALDIQSLLTSLEAIVSVDRETGRITVALSGRALRATIAEMKEG